MFVLFYFWLFLFYALYLQDMCSVVYYCDKRFLFVFLYFCLYIFVPYFVCCFCFCFGVMFECSGIMLRSVILWVYDVLLCTV